MARPRSLLPSLLHLLLTLLTLTTALPSPPQAHNWNTPNTCVRQLASYNLSQCTRDLNDLIRQARESIKEIEIVGMRLPDVLSLLPENLPVTHTCYPRNIREQNPNNDPGWQWTDDRFVPFR